MTQTNIGLLSSRDNRFAPIEKSSSREKSAPTVSFRGKSIAVGDYLSRFPVTEFVRFSSDEDVTRAQSVAEAKSCALDFTLMLLDPELSDRLKNRIVVELEDLLSGENSERYVLDILLAQPISESASLGKAIEAVASYSHCNRVFKTLVDSRVRSGLARKAWLSIRSNPMVEQVGKDLVIGNLIRSGIWRTVVVDFTTKAEAKQGMGKVLLAGSECCDARIIKSFVTEYASFLPEGEPVRRTLPVKEEEYSSSVATESSYVSVPERRSADDEQERAVKEVDAIVELYLAGDDTKALRFRNELAARQDNDEDQSHFVKSLCHIASRCSTGGRRDIAADCLTEATEKTKGVDARLFIQIGQHFKTLREFDKAINCFNHANELAKDGEEIDTVNRELSRLLTAEGKYPEALNSFRRLDDIETSPFSRTSMATVYRKMGQLVSARELYNSVWFDLPSHHQAFAGLAEANRQAGRYEKSICKYEHILNSMNVDDQSTKIYKLSLSSLFCIIGRLDNSQAILDELLDSYSQDPSIQLAMAKVLRLRGDFSRADNFFRRSHEKLHETEVLSGKLYETAMLRHNSKLDPAVGAASVLPEFKGLERCNDLLRSIIAGNFNFAVDRQSRPNHVYRLHHDFDSVLLYHCRKALDKNTSPTDDISINRLRKRGIKDLRGAVKAVDQNDLTTALELEQRVCLVLA